MTSVYYERTLTVVGRTASRVADALGKVDPERGVPLASLSHLATVAASLMASDVVSAAAREFGLPRPSTSELAPYARQMADSLQGIIGQLAGGRISPDQAASWCESSLTGNGWQLYQAVRNDYARRQQATHGTWVPDPDVKEHCDDCQERADHGPYALDDLPGLPADGSAKCGPGCACWVAYHAVVEGDDDA